MIQPRQKMAGVLQPVDDDMHDAMRRLALALQHAARDNQPAAQDDLPKTLEQARADDQVGDEPADAEDRHEHADEAPAAAARLRSLAART